VSSLTKCKKRNIIKIVKIHTATSLLIVTYLTSIKKIAPGSFVIRRTDLDVLLAIVMNMIASLEASSSNKIPVVSDLKIL
jgi:hypothetical protein